MMQPLVPLVFVIDDSPTVRKLVEVALQREGFRVISFADGVEAMRSLVQPDVQAPDIIFLDILLPKMDGFQVARYLRSNARFSRIPIVMLTRCSGVVDRLKARVFGVVHYMTKPFTTQDLAKMAKNVVGSPVAI